MTQDEVNRILFDRLSKRYPDAHIDCYYLSDGGDGFLESIKGCGLELEQVNVQVPDHHGRLFTSYYLWSPNTGTAYVELANSSGASLLKAQEKDVMNTSTTGTGALIRHAADLGASTIYVGLGGSASNDAGMGIAHSFGYRFMDAHGNELLPSGKNMCNVTRILLPPSEFPEVSVCAVHDVGNVLFGPEGAAKVYGPQKGGNQGDIDKLDKGAKHFSEIVKRDLKIDAAFEEGSGAAGGAAYGLKVFLGASFKQGTSFMLDTYKISEKIKGGVYQLIVSGEGRVDRQTTYGKLLSGLGERAVSGGIPFVVFCGQDDLGVKAANAIGITDIVEINENSKSLKWNLENARKRLYDTAEGYFRDFDINEDDR